VVETRTNMN